jgi:hypothetical protein
MELLSGGFPVCRPTKRHPVAGLVALALAAFAAGCGWQGKTGAPTQVIVVQHVPSAPCEIELSSPKATLVEGQTVRFEVTYRFTKGKPDKYYACDISFPGTTNHGVCTMFSWELKPEGVFRDGIVIKNPPVKSFEITMSEAASPQDGYKVISNTVSGLVE